MPAHKSSDGVPREDLLTRFLSGLAELRRLPKPLPGKGVRVTVEAGAWSPEIPCCDVDSFEVDGACCIPATCEIDGACIPATCEIDSPCCEDSYCCGITAPKPEVVEVKKETGQRRYDFDA